MIKKLKPRSEFTRNVITLMTGTTIAQAIPIAISPLLTRMYTPEDFGVFALYMTITSIISVFATGRYELAVMLPEEDEDAINIVVLSLSITLIVSLISLFIVLMFKLQITILLGNPEISQWLYFIPLSVLLTGTYQNVNFWNNRKKKFKQLSENRVIRSTTTASFNLGIGTISNGSGGLILGTIIGQLASTIVLGKVMLNKDIFGLINKSKIIASAKKHVNFPKYDVIATISNILSHQISHVLFNVFVSAATSGYYFLVQKVMGVPISLISSAVSDVFKQQSSSSFAKNGNAKEIFLKVLTNLTILSFPPFILLFIFAQDLFVFVFGKNWAEAGLYAKILVPMFFLQFIASPLSYILYITDSQKLNLMLQLCMFFFVLISFLCGYIFESTKLIVILISCLTSSMYIIYIIISFQKSKGGLK